MTYYFWGYEDGIIADDDGVFACETCPCETGTGTVGCDCIYCIDDWAPYQISVVIPALNNSGCSDCASIAGTYVITQLASPNCCTWEGRFANPTSCTGLGYDKMLIAMNIQRIGSPPITPYQIVLDIDITFYSDLGGSAYVGQWRDIAPGSSGEQYDCNFNSFSVAARANGACDILTDPDPLSITAV